MRSDLAFPKNWKMSGEKEHFNVDCFGTNSWVEIPKQGFLKHTKLIKINTGKSIKTTNLLRLDFNHILISKTMYK